MNLREFLKFKKVSASLTDFLGHHPGRNLLILFFLLTIYALIIGGLYAIGAPTVTENAADLQINAELYQKVLSRLKARDANIQEGIGQNHPDIFR